MLPNKDLVTIDMGKAKFAPEQIPTTKKLWETPIEVGEDVIPVWGVGMGNPHCVSFFSNVHVRVLVFFVQHVVV